MGNLDDALAQLAIVAQHLATFSPPMAARVERLQRDLADPDERTHWSIPAAQTVLDSEGLVARFVRLARRRTNRAISLLEWVRNVLVLLPIAVTWYGLSAAAGDYELAVRLHPQLVEVPFLLLWQRGFEQGAATWLTFSHLALVDALLIITVVFLTFTVHSITATREYAIDVEANKLRGEVEDAVTAVTLALVDLGQRDIILVADQISAALTRTTSTFERTTRELLDHLALERSRLVEFSTQREEEVSALSAFAANLVSGVEVMRGEAERIAAASSSFEAAGRALRLQVENLERLQTEEGSAVARLEEALVASAGRSRELEIRLGVAASTVAEAAAANGNGALALSASTLELQRYLASATTRNEEILKALSNERTEREGASKAMASYCERIGAAVDALKVVEGNLQALGTAVDQTTGRFTSVREGLDTVVAAQMAVQAALADETNRTITLHQQLGNQMAKLGEALIEATAKGEDQTTRSVAALNRVEQAWAWLAGNAEEQQALGMQLERLTKVLGEADNQATRDAAVREVLANQIRRLSDVLDGLDGHTRSQTEEYQALLEQVKRLTAVLDTAEAQAADLAAERQALGEHIKDLATVLVAARDELDRNASDRQNATQELQRIASSLSHVDGHGHGLITINWPSRSRPGQ